MRSADPGYHAQIQEHFLKKTVNFRDLQNRYTAAKFILQRGSENWLKLAPKFFTRTQKDLDILDWKSVKDLVYLV